MEYIRILDIIGVSQEIYDAIDTYDMAKMVRTATKALTRIDHLDNQERCTKSMKISKSFFKESIKLNVAGLYNLAVMCNNMALAVAPAGSQVMMLAYGMRAEYMFNIKNYTACQKDIETCLTMHCPMSYQKKLKKICEDCRVPLMLERKQRAQNMSPTLSTFFQFNCKRNAAVPCASADVTFINQDGAKRVIAGKYIATGDVVVVERAFTTFNSGERFLACYYCNRITPCLLPCKGCCQALFCDIECRDRCMKEYHRIECKIVDYLVIEYLQINITLVTRTAIKLSLKLKWDAFIKESENIGSSRMKTASIRDTYNSDEPLSILSYDDEKCLIEGKMFNGSIIFAKIIHSLDKVPDYFPREPSKRKAAKEAMARIMLKLYVTFTNKIPLICTADLYDTNGKSAEVYRKQTNYGWFSMTSKLKHSCIPNLMVVGLNDSVALVALRTIRKGEELTITYTNHFYLDAMLEYDQPFQRATELFLTIGHVCKDCKVCDEDWNKDSAELTAEMTFEHLVKANKLGNCENDEELFQAICEILNVFPLRSYGHKQAFFGFISMIFKAQRYHCKNIFVGYA